MRARLRDAASHVVMALLLAACDAAAQSPVPCAEWQNKFYGVQATWTNTATTRAHVERLFGMPSTVEQKGFCTQLHYTATGCSATFAVCAGDTVVSKTFTIGAAAVPAFITSDPAALAESVRALQDGLREMQTRIERLQKSIDGLAPPPNPLPETSPPETARRAAVKPIEKRPEPAQCAAMTKAGERCSRSAAGSSAYCWQHKR